MYTKPASKGKDATKEDEFQVDQGQGRAAAALEKKAEVQGTKNAQKQAQKDGVEAQEWAKGAKDLSSKEQEEAKRKEALAKKLEREALLAAEEAALPQKKPLLRGNDKKAAQKSSGLDGAFNQLTVGEYSASGIDGAMELMDVATQRTTNNDSVEKHPERRVKSAFAAFEEREMEILKTESPGLRLSQLKQALQKKWKKSPENPMNQAQVAYNATKDEIRGAIDTQRSETLELYKS